jgi:hypothetical protein
VRSSDVSVRPHLALVFSELDSKTFLRVGNPLQGSQGDGKLHIAKRADSDSRDRAQPFDYSKIALRHRHSFPHASRRLNRNLSEPTPSEPL